MIDYWKFVPELKQELKNYRDEQNRIGPKKIRRID